MNSQDNPFLRLDASRSSTPLAKVAAVPPLRLLQKARYPNLYVWFVFLAAMDIMMTWIVLAFGGSEANVLAHWFLSKWGLPGMVGLKFASVLLVVLTCEVIGRIRDNTGKNLARFAVGVNVLPVTLAFIQLLINKFGGGGEEESDTVVMAVHQGLVLCGLAA